MADCQCGRPLTQRPGDLGPACTGCRGLPDSCDCPPVAARAVVGAGMKGRHRLLPPPGQLAIDPMPDEPWTQLGYAHRLIDSYGDQLRYVHTWKRWLIWDGQRWAHDLTGQAQRWAKLIARAMTDVVLASNDAGFRKDMYSVAEKGETNAFIVAALTLASSDSRVAITHEVLDADPYLLNCANGTLDLRTGEIRPHDRADLLTKMTTAAYGPDAPCPAFTDFLQKVQPDELMRQFLARLLGHALEGRVIEHILPIFHGAGKNGKSTLVTAVVEALGDYADAADADLLNAKTFDAHPTSVADLFGLRLARIDEGDKGRRLAEGTVKRLTGGDRLKARRMREDFWSFNPTHTFVMLTNHKPVIGGADEGIWRRIRLVPWNVVIAEAERDLHLGDRLRLELDAILAWLVAGYADWKTRGLDEPEAVRDATSAYRDESDALSRFLEESCTTTQGTAGSTELFTAWAKWCAGEGEDPGTHKAFASALENKGFDKYQSNGRVRWRGIGLMTSDNEEGSRGL